MALARDERIAIDIDRGLGHRRKIQPYLGASELRSGRDSVARVFWEVRTPNSVGFLIDPSIARMGCGGRISIEVPDDLGAALAAEPKALAIKWNLRALAQA